MYLPAAQGTPDAVGAERYRLGARLSTGSNLDLAEAYEWGWDEFRRLDEEMRREADTILPGAGPIAVMRHLDENGEAVDGVEEIRVWLQKMMDTAMDELAGTHFDIPAPVRTVEAMIAPAGSAAAPYYTRPSLDFSRPGRTWLPTLGATRFPLWGLVSTWYHEGVPGHHLQLAQWAHLADQLSTFQTTIGSVSGNTEGWALYAERLADELGYLTLPGTRLGYLDAQQMRAIRVVIDIGMHLQLEVPAELAASTRARRGRPRSRVSSSAPSADGPVRSWTARSCATWAGRARRSATSSASAPGSPGATQPEPHGARSSTSSPGTPPRCRWAASAWTT